MQRFPGRLLNSFTPGHVFDFVPAKAPHPLKRQMEDERLASRWRARQLVERYERRDQYGANSTRAGSKSGTQHLGKRRAGWALSTSLIEGFNLGVLL